MRRRKFLVHHVAQLALLLSSSLGFAAKKKGKVYGILAITQIPSQMTEDEYVSLKPSFVDGEAMARLQKEFMSSGKITWFRSEFDGKRSVWEAHFRSPEDREDWIATTHPFFRLGQMEKLSIQSHFSRFES